MDTTRKYTLILVAFCALLGLYLYGFADSLRMCWHVPVAFTWAGSFHALATAVAVGYLRRSEATSRKLATAMCAMMLSTLVSVELAGREHSQDGHVDATYVEGSVEF